MHAKQKNPFHHDQHLQFLYSSVAIVDGHIFRDSFLHLPIDHVLHFSLQYKWIRSHPSTSPWCPEPEIPKNKDVADLYHAEEKQFHHSHTGFGLSLYRPT